MSSEKNVSELRLLLCKPTTPPRSALCAPCWMRRRAETRPGSGGVRLLLTAFAPVITAMSGLTVGKTPMTHHGAQVACSNIGGTLVIYDSTIEHEVLPTRRERHLISGRFRESNDDWERRRGC